MRRRPSPFTTTFVSLNLISNLIHHVHAQTECIPIMQSLLQKAESAPGYGSWDACCARLGIDCSLTRSPTTNNSSPCDSAHPSRASCNKIPQGTICMISRDTLVTNSPCGRSTLRACTNTLKLNGVNITTTTTTLSQLGITPVTVITSGVLGTQLCCTPTSCRLTTQSAPCTSPYTMSCVSDGANIICVPFDSPDDFTYFASISQDCSSGPGSPNPSRPPPNDPMQTTPPIAHKSNKQALIIGAAIGGLALLIGIIATLTWFHLRAKKRRSSTTPPPPRSSTSTSSIRVQSNGSPPMQLQSSASAPSLALAQNPTQLSLARSTTPRRPRRTHHRTDSHTPPLVLSTTTSTSRYTDPDPGMISPLSDSSRATDDSNTSASTTTTVTVARLAAMEAMMVSISQSMPRNVDSQVTFHESVSRSGPGPAPAPEPPPYEKI